MPNFQGMHEEELKENGRLRRHLEQAERDLDEARAELWDMSARVCELRHSYALVLRGPIPYTAGTAISDFIGSLDKVLSGSPAPTQNDADRLAAIERQVLWRTEDMPVDAKAWEKVGGECWWVMHQDDAAGASFAPDLRPDEPGPLFLPILDPPE